MYKQPFECELYLPNQLEVALLRQLGHLWALLSPRSFELGQRAPPIWLSLLSALPAPNPAPPDVLNPLLLLPGPALHPQPPRQGRHLATLGSALPGLGPGWGLVIGFCKAS